MKAIERKKENLTDCSLLGDSPGWETWHGDHVREMASQGIQLWAFTHLRHGRWKKGYSSPRMLILCADKIRVILHSEFSWLGGSAWFRVLESFLLCPTSHRYTDSRTEVSVMGGAY